MKLIAQIYPVQELRNSFQFPVLFPGVVLEHSVNVAVKSSQLLSLCGSSSGGWTKVRNEELYSFCWISGSHEDDYEENILRYHTGCFTETSVGFQQITKALYPRRQNSSTS
jgi:hypothetical protein